MDNDAAEARRTATAMLRYGPMLATAAKLSAPPRTLRLIERALADGYIEQQGDYLVLVLAPRSDARPLSLVQDHPSREVAGAIMTDHQTVVEIAAALKLPIGQIDTILNRMAHGQCVLEKAGFYTLTPFGRVSLTLSENETAVIYAIAAGERGERRLVARLQMEGNDCRQAMEHLIEQKIIRKTRRYYEICDTAYAIVPGENAPTASRLLSALGG